MPYRVTQCATLFGMGGRYVRRSDKQKIAEVFHAATGDLSDLNFAPDDDIRPTTVQPIIRANRDTGDSELVAARWGFIPCWQKAHEKFPPTTFNARSEGIEKASMWRDAFLRHRCLVPADSFYEWHKVRAKNTPKYEIGMTDREPFALASYGVRGITQAQRSGFRASPSSPLIRMR